MSFTEILTNIKAGLITGSFSIILAISYASFIFTGNLAPYLPIGFGLSIVSTIILRLTVAKFSAIPGVVCGPMAVVYLFIALMSAAISTNLAQKGLGDQIFPTIMTLIILSTFSIAIFMMLLGYFRLGSLTRYIPYPVISGLLSGIGLSIFFNGLSILMRKPLTWNNFPEVFKWGILSQILVSLFIALAFRKMMEVKFHLFIKIALLFGVAALFVVSYKWISLTHDYWFIEPMPSGRMWPPSLHFSDFYLVNWSELLGQISLFGTMNFIVILSLVVSMSGIEIFLKKDFDIDQELKITGFANFITMIFGGIAGIPFANQTIPNIEQGGTRYLSAITSSILAMSVLFIDASNLKYIPKSILAGVIMYLGIYLLVEWGYRSKFRLPLVDYTLLLVILSITGFFGFIYGTVVGIIFSAAIFIFTYSKINVVKYVLNGDSYQSNIERSIYEQEFLKNQGKHIYIIKMQGFIFFGTAYHLLKIIKKRLTDPTQETVQYLILDFALVTNLDSSAVLSFSKLIEMAKTLHFLTIFSHANNLVLKQLTIAGFNKKNDQNYHFFSNLDFSMEWCENRILADHSISDSEQTIPHGLSEILPFFETVKYQKGEYVIHQGECFSELYFILSGKVTALLEKPHGLKIRLKTMSAGTFIGELGFFSEAPRSSSVIAEIPTILHRITQDRLEEIKHKNPQIVFSFYEVIARILAERVANQNKTMELLIK